MRRHLSAFTYKKLFENHLLSTFPTSSSFFRVISTLLEHTYRVLKSALLKISAYSANKNKSQRNRLNDSGPKIDPCGRP